MFFTRYYGDVKRILVILSLILNSLILYPEDDFSIILSNDYFNVLNYRSSELCADSYINKLGFSFLWDSGDVSGGFSLDNERSYISAAGIDISGFDSFKVTNSDMLHDANNLYPTLFFGFEQNRIELSFRERVKYNFSIELPLSDNLKLGLQHEIVPIFEFPFELFGDYDFKAFMEQDKHLFLVQYSLENISIEGFYSVNKLEMLPDYSDYRNISFKYNMNSDYSLGGALEMIFDKSSIEFSLSSAKYSIAKDKLYGFRGDELFLALQNKADVYITELNLSFILDKASICIKHSIANIKPLDINATTYPFIYGPIAYLKYNVSFPEIYFFNTALETEYEFDSVIGSIVLGIDINRFYTDWRNIKYYYNEYTAILGKPTLFGTSTNEEYKLEFDHLNIIRLKIEDTVKISTYITLKLSLKQYIPFFDSNINKLFIKDESSSSGSGSKESFFGGTNVSAIIKYDF